MKTEANTQPDQATERPVRFLRLAEVRHRTGDSASSIYRKVAAGQFPRPIKIGPNASAWIESEIEAYQRALIEASRSAA